MANDVSPALTSAGIHRTIRIFINTLRLNLTLQPILRRILCKPILWRIGRYEWLKRDLLEANQNRETTPWIVVYAHRSFYCSCDTDCDDDARYVRDGRSGAQWSGQKCVHAPGGVCPDCPGLEELFFAMGVDLLINGHGEFYLHRSRYCLLQAVRMCLPLSAAAYLLFEYKHVLVLHFVRCPGEVVVLSCMMHVRTHV
eukprot:COSAG05_NODE_8237_length_723_cov_1.389423_1_plen_198_part_00